MHEHCIDTNNKINYAHEMRIPTVTVECDVIIEQIGAQGPESRMQSMSLACWIKWVLRIVIRFTIVVATIQFRFFFTLHQLSTASSSASALAAGA